MAAAFIELLRGDKARREIAYAQLEALSGSDGAMSGSDAAAISAASVSVTGVDVAELSDEARIAVACVAPMLEHVLAADVSVVDAAEYQRATLALHAALLVEPTQMCAQLQRTWRFAIPWKAKGNAYNAVFKKEPSELSRDDALTVACDSGLWAVSHACGQSRCSQLAGVTFAEFLPHAMENPLLTPVATSGAREDKLASLFFDIVRDPQGASEIVQSGAWFALVWLLGGTAENSGPRAAALIESGLIETAVAALHRSSPEDWLSCRTATGVNAGAIFTLSWTLSTLVFPGMSIATVLLDRGFIDAGFAAMKRFEANGASVATVLETNVMTIWAFQIVLSKLDLTASDAAPIVQLLQQAPSTVRFVLDNPVVHVPDLGFVSSAHMSAVCALAFGKEEEGGGFMFSQEQVDDTVVSHLSVFSGTASSLVRQLESFFLRAIVHLCISGASVCPSGFVSLPLSLSRAPARSVLQCCPVKLTSLSFARLLGPLAAMPHTQMSTRS